MELKQIKLAGFKSFVDPTVLDLRSHLVAVVGPNGCGKSNVIDAVRWVMGESSAKTLRGESITDVIFNGSNTRKPIGQASIELIFDNSDGTIGGEYASYAEISVRREVNRDAVSNYYLNGTRCRRKDIKDVFLGTGLGARSYSIIEQGMISRVIESKPEDLRNFVEEAAGISVYKQRRHDTELRMRHTTENLARLEDLREEQVKLLERLKRQSESAQKYKTFNAEKDLLESQLLAVRWQTYDEKLSAHAEEIRTLSVHLEEKLAMRTGITAELERVRLQHEEKSDVHEAAQGKFYELGAAVARTEQSLQYHRERKLQLEDDIAQIKQSIVDSTAQKDTDNEQLFACEEQLAEILPNYEAAVAAAEQADELYQDARLNLDACNERWETVQLQAQEPQQEAEVQKARIEQLDKQTRDLQTRIDRLQQESATLDGANIEATVAELSAQLLILEEDTNGLKTEITKIQHEISQQRSDLQQQQDQLDKVRGVIQQRKGREASLQALQQAALGKDDRVKQEWLAKHNLIDAARLAESLTVAAGWERAVETVLADYLEAVCVDNQLADVVAAVNELSNANITILDTTVATYAAGTASSSLADKVTTKLPIHELLQNIIVADNLPDALALRPQLQAQQSIITKDGIWLGRSWLRVIREQDNKRGLLQREQELQSIKSELEQQVAIAANLEDTIAKANDNLHDLELALTTKQQAEAANSAQLRDISNKHSAAQQKLEHTRNRLHRISIEIEDHKQQLSGNSEDSAIARHTLEEAIESMADLSIKREQTMAQREQAIAKEKATKLHARELQDNMHELEIAKQTLATQLQGLQHTISRVDQQLAELHKRYQQLQQSLQADIDPGLQIESELEELLASRVVAESELQIARSELEMFAMQMKTQEQQRGELERAAQGIKDILDKCRLERQTLEVRKETINEQLAIHSIDVQLILNQLPEDADEAVWAERIDALQKKIANLGAINLAAVEEFEAETQRQQYLEVQYADLREALTTLENAIKKIDKETRAKFQETFETINTNFSTLFPKVFGGGRAYLEVVGDDLLNAGVTVMAQPPGKKNSTIHLLSGGEKALTAVALVFAIFQINPAPFCMLDEVDAPLDESNVVRFGNLIKEMSDKVQFIIITHNKTTMEIANQLVGVTMKEPGVSRLVSVDINEAVEMALA
jgi:chromosome segregation protein